MSMLSAPLLVRSWEPFKSKEGNIARAAGMMDSVRKETQGPVWIRHEIVVVLLVLVTIKGLPVISAQRQGRSYACGAPNSLTTNGISWQSDAEIAPPGSKTTIVSGDYIRYFSSYKQSNPQQNANCYDKLPEVRSQGPLLLRVTCIYKNYDELDEPPEFELWIGTAKVAYVNMKKDDPSIEEVIFSPGDSSKREQVFCLVAVKGAPVISYIELRPLPANSYTAEGRLLRKRFRIDCGKTDGALRYPDDDYDRVWDKDAYFSDNTFIQLSNVSMDGEDLPERPPKVVLETARNLSAGADIQYNIPVDTSGDFSVKIYTPSTINTTAEVNGASSTSSVSGTTIRVTTFSGVADTSGTLNLTVRESDEGVVEDVLRPEINALEVFEEITPEGPSADADSMNTINDYYDLGLNWFGDPCRPVAWEGLVCSSEKRVTSLDLSAQNLALSPSSVLSEFTSLTSLTRLNLSSNRFGSEIPDFTGLNSLEILDLRNNDFTGTLDSLGVLPALTQLFVSFNPKLSGEIPSSLRRSNLVLDIQGTCIGTAANCSLPPTSGVPSPPKTKNSNSNTGVIIGVAVAAVLAILVIPGFCIFVFCWRRKAKTRSGHEVGGENADLRNWSTARVFTFKELETATHNFKKELGEGSFGPVYYGVLSNGQNVAIKLRQDTSPLGAESFKNEVYLLSRVHHPNLVSLLGYCQEGKNQLLVYEYMPGGTLMDHLYGTMTPLDWVARLRIAIGAATGISYLHNESDPKIIHRDVKSTNILLGSNMTAKVSDFGLSKLVTKTGATHVTTLVKGTAGYLDPEYFTTNQLTEKSDVYSFGVVLLEIICGREPLTGNRAPDEYNLLAWAKPYLLAKTYDGIVDRVLRENYNPMSVSVVASLALRCIERNGENRPTMHQVLRELEEALILEESIEKIVPSPSQSNSASHSAAFDFRSRASDTPPDSVLI